MWKGIFFSTYNLKTHINAAHNGQKYHKCDLCENSFSIGKNLNSHMIVVHNGQKIPIMCRPSLK